MQGLKRDRPLRTEVLVVGAGPAGSAAAAAAAAHGVEVLVLERKKTIGRPVQCAEYVPASLIGELGCNDSAICAQKIRGMRSYIGKKLERQTPAPGFIINRDAFDRWLACRAESSGAVVLRSTLAVDYADESTILVQSGPRRFFEVTAKVIIAADGPRSLLRRRLKTQQPDLIPAGQMSFKLNTPSEFTNIYLDRLIRGGYGWLFPKNDIAHVGLGLRPTPSSPRLTVVLKSFISQLKETGLITGGPLASTAGWIPVEPMQNCVRRETIFVGDAAGQTHPITGAGIFSAVSCGTMAGSWAARAVQLENSAILENYEREWREMFGRSISHAAVRRKSMETRWHDFDQIIKSSWIAFPGYHGR